MCALLLLLITHGVVNGSIDDCSEESSGDSDKTLFGSMRVARPLLPPKMASRVETVRDEFEKSALQQSGARG